MQKNLLSAFIILCYLFLSTSSVFAKPKDRKQQNQEVDNQPEAKLDYKNIKYVKEVFDLAMVHCLDVLEQPDAKEWKEAKRLVEDLQEYWQVAYQLAQKKSNKKKLNKKEQAFIQERIELINQLRAPLGLFGTQLTEANTLVEEIVMVAEKFFPDSVLLADTYLSLARNYEIRHCQGEQIGEYIIKALQITTARLGNYHLKTARIYYILGYLSLIEPNTAIIFLKTAQKIAFQLPREQEGVLGLISNVYRALGKVYEQKSAYAQALTNYEEFLALLPEFALSEEMFKSYTTMMQHSIQNVQEKIDKQKQKEKKKRMSHPRSED